MKEFLAAKRRFDENVPHFIGYGLDFSRFVKFFYFDYISQGDNEMFLEIVETRFFPSLIFNYVLFVLHAKE